MAETVDCPDCDGSGAETPDCPVCKGRRTLHWRLAIRHGYRKVDLINFDESDGCGYCPSCGGDCCEICQGDGTIPAGEPAQQETRLLLIGLHGDHSQPLLGNPVHPVDRETPCSWAAMLRLRDRGAATVSRSIFGDDVCLTRVGWRAAMALYEDGTQAWPIPSSNYWHGSPHDVFDGALHHYPLTPDTPDGVGDLTP